MRTPSLVLVLSWVLALSGSAGWAGQSKAPLPMGRAEAPPPNVQDTLKASVVASEDKLGELQPWQKKIFDEEVTPRFQEFVLDYRPSASGIIVDVNVNAIKKYLMFYGPKAVKRDDSRIAILLQPEEGCARCAEAAEGIRKTVKASFERRGLVPWFVKPEELGEHAGGAAALILDPSAGKTVDDQLQQLATQKNAAGLVVIQWRLAPVDSIDSAHADEKHYLVRTSIAAGATTSYSLKNEGKLELLENDSIEVGVTRLLTQAFTDIGSQMMVAQENNDTRNGEVLISISGVGDFANYTAVKSQIQSTLADVGAIEERVISRGQVTFAVRTRKTMDELKTKLNGIQIDSRPVAVTDSGDNMIKAEIR